MKIALNGGGGRNLISAYGPGQVTINEVVYTRSLVLTPERVLPDWPPQTFDELVRAHFDALTAMRPEVAILGTGARLQFPRTADLQALIAANIGIEVMDTGAACRTFNIVAADGRRVVAALLMI